MQKILYLEFFYGCKNGKYLGVIIDNSVITYDEIIHAIKSISKKYVPTKTDKTTGNSENFYILLSFLLVIITLLIAVWIYCCFIKYLAKKTITILHHK